MRTFLLDVSEKLDKVDQAMSMLSGALEMLLELQSHVLQGMLSYIPFGALGLLA